MNIAELGALGELIGSIAVLATLVYLAVQLHQTKQAIQSSSMQSGLASMNHISQNVAADQEFAEIVETGSTYAGTMIRYADPGFVKIFKDADIVISKGQGNFETLDTEKEKDIFFIFKVKCRIVADYSGLPLNSLVMAYGSSFINRN